MSAPAPSPPSPTQSEPAFGSPLSSGLVKAAAISIIPWTIGSLLSPFGEPHPVLLVLPIAALITLIVAVRTKLRARRHFVAWTLTSLLVAASAVRFLVLPFVSELGAAGTETDESGDSIRRVILALAGVKLGFYLAAAGLFLSTGWMLLTRKGRQEPETALQRKGSDTSSR